MPSVQQKRGLFANLPSSSLLPGQVFFTTDRQTAHFPTDATTMVPVVPAIDALDALASVDGAADLLIMHDASAAGVKEKRITFNSFKTALNIAAESSDEKVSVVDGGTAGFIFGTDGTDGILRMNTSMAMTKDAGNAFVTLAVETVDCGTF